MFPKKTNMPKNIQKHIQTFRKNLINIILQVISWYFKQLPETVL